MDPILYWNEVLLEANKTSHTDNMDTGSNGPTRSSRSFAITHLAMYDAYFGVYGDMARKYLTLRPPYTGNVSPAHAAAAVAAAAHAVLSALYPSQKSFFDKQHAKAGFAGPGLLAAHLYGLTIAKLLLARRKDDPTADDDGYAGGVAPGQHRSDPDNPGQRFHGPKYGNSLAFAVSGLHGLNPPPGLGDAEYAAALAEVRTKGIAPHLAGTLPPGSPIRTTDETLLGVFWGYDGAAGLGTPPRLYNQIVRTIVMARTFTVAQNAELFALVNAAMGDAGIFAWHEKYRYDVWRPILGVREASPYMGPASDCGAHIGQDCDPNWLPLGAPLSNRIGKNFTPPFPAYPSGHATFGAAAFHMVRRFLGVNGTGPDGLLDGLCFVSDEHNGYTTDNTGALRSKHSRTFNDGLWGMIIENALSRIFLGVHWYFDAFGRDEEGNPDFTQNVGGVPLGLAIADDIFDNGLKQSTVKHP